MITSNEIRDLREQDRIMITFKGYIAKGFGNSTNVVLRSAGRPLILREEFLLASHEIEVIESTPIEDPVGTERRSPTGRRYVKITTNTWVMLDDPRGRTERYTDFRMIELGAVKVSNA